MTCSDEFSIVLPDSFTTVASLPSDESLGCLQSPSGLGSELMEDETIRDHPR
jgi:hypothetical protein